MNRSTEQSIRFAARQAGVYFVIQNARFVFRSIRRVSIIGFLLITSVLEVLHYTRVH